MYREAPVACRVLRERNGDTVFPADRSALWGTTAHLISAMTAIFCSVLRLKNEGGERMSTNLTDEIRSVEAAAAQKVADAKAEAQDLVIRTRNSAALRVKEAKQAHFREYRSRLAQVEAEAAETAAQAVEQGKTEARQFVESHEDAVKKTAQWLAEEVVSQYGRCSR